MPGHCRYASAMHGQRTGAVAYPRPADKGAHFPKEIMLTDVRWYVAYPLSTTRSSDPLRWEVLLHYQYVSMWGRRSLRRSLLSSGFAQNPVLCPIRHKKIWAIRLEWR